MRFLTSFSLRNPAAIILLSLLIAAGGLYASTGFKQEMMPEVDYPVLSVTAVYPGAGPQEVLNDVTIPIENALRQVDGVKNVVSSSSNHASWLQLEFDFSDDMEAKKRLVEDALSQTALPTEALEPEVKRSGTSAFPTIYTSVIAGGSGTPEEVDELVRTRVLPELSAVEGVARVETVGLTEEGVRIALNAGRMADKQVTYQQVQQALMANHYSMPLGELAAGDTNLPVQITGGIREAEELLALPVSAGVKLGDVAEIVQGGGFAKISRTNGEPGVSLNIYKSGDANTVELSHAIREAYEELESEHGGKLDALILFDNAEEVEESIASMLREGGLGALFAAVLILFFLRNLRATIIAVVSIPLSILVALISLRTFTDVTLNIMTLGGMAVATGRVVDDSIVVIENIVRRLQQEKGTRDLIQASTLEVGKAITSSTLTTVAVFAPLGLLQGMTGEFFRPFALTVGISLLASLLVAFTIVPLMSWAFMRTSVPAERRESAMARGYRRVLRWSLNHKVTVLLLSAVIFAASLPLVGVVGMTFLPETDNKYVFAQLKMPKGTDLTSMEAEAKRIDELLRTSPEVDATNVTIGNSAAGAAATEIADWFVSLSPDTDIDAFIDEMEPIVETPEGAVFDIQQEMGGAAQIAVTVTGPNLDAIHDGADRIAEAVGELDGTDHVKTNLAEGTTGLQIVVRPEDAMQNGLSVMQASSMLRPYLSEQRIGRIGEGADAEPLYLMLGGEELGSAQAVADLKLTSPLGTEIAVGDIADVVEVQLPADLQLKNGEEFATVTASITDKNAASVNAALKEALEALTLPDNVEYALGGSDEEIQSMLTDMMIAMGIALGMVYIVMVITFREAKAPLAILFSLPFALAGGLVGTLIAGEPISVSSLIGFLMLIGIVVTNAIVLVERVHQQLEHGLSIREALVEAGGTRLRPILMTAIATICALLPLGLGLGGGTIISSGLAVIVIGGLTTSTLLTLVVVPVMYELLYFRRSRAERKSAGKGSELAA